MGDRVEAMVQATVLRTDKRRALAAIATEIGRGEISFPTTAQMALRIREALGDPDCAIGTVGTEHILFGTDYPFGNPNSLAEGIRRVESLAIDEAAKGAIFSGTADRLLR